MPIQSPQRQHSQAVDIATRADKPRLGLVGGLGAVAGADILHRIVKSTPAHSEDEHLDISFVQHPLHETGDPSSPAYSPTRRKLYVYDELRDMEEDNRDIALVPCFISQTFLDEITPEISIKVLGIAEAIRDGDSHAARLAMRDAISQGFDRAAGRMEKDV